MPASEIQIPFQFAQVQIALQSPQDTKSKQSTNEICMQNKAKRQLPKLLQRQQKKGGMGDASLDL